MLGFSTFSDDITLVLVLWVCKRSTYQPTSFLVSLQAAMLNSSLSSHWFISLEIENGWKIEIYGTQWLLHVSFLQIMIRKGKNVCHFSPEKNRSGDGIELFVARCWRSKWKFRAEIENRKRKTLNQNCQGTKHRLASYFINLKGKLLERWKGQNNEKPKEVTVKVIRCPLHSNDAPNEIINFKTCKKLSILRKCTYPSSIVNFRAKLTSLHIYQAFKLSVISFSSVGTLKLKQSCKLVLKKIQMYERTKEWSYEILKNQVMSECVVMHEYEMCQGPIQKNGSHCSKEDV